MITMIGIMVIEAETRQVSDIETRHLTHWPRAADISGK